MRNEKRGRDERLPIVKTCFGLGFSFTQAAWAMRVSRATITKDMRAFGGEGAFPDRTARENAFGCALEYYAMLESKRSRGDGSEKDGELSDVIGKLLGADAIIEFLRGVVATMMKLGVPCHRQEHAGYARLLRSIFGEEPDVQVASRYADFEVKYFREEYLRGIAFGEIPAPVSLAGVKQDMLDRYVTAERRREIAPVWPEKKTVEAAFNAVLETLSKREQEVIKRRLGIGGECETLKGIALTLKVTEERIRQIEEEALLKLRHPSRSERLAWLSSSQPYEEDFVPDELSVNPWLFKSVDELELSVRAARCLRDASIGTIGELVQKRGHDLLVAKNFGRRSLREIKKLLLEHGLALGIEFPRELKMLIKKRKQK